MRNVAQLDHSQPYTKIRSLDTAKQKVFFIQDGIEYDAAGTAVNQRQIKAYYDKQVADAEARADDAKAAAKAAADEAKAAAAEAKAATASKTTG